MLTLKQIAEIAHKINPSITNVVLQQQLWNGEITIRFYRGPVHFNDERLEVYEETDVPYRIGWEPGLREEYAGAWNKIEGFVDYSMYPHDEAGIYDFSKAIITFDPEEPTLHSLEEIADYVAPLFPKARYFYFQENFNEDKCIIIESEQMGWDGDDMLGLPIGWYGSSRHEVAFIYTKDEELYKKYEGDFSKAEVIRDNGERTEAELSENAIIDTVSKLFLDTLVHGDCFIKTPKEEE